MKGRKKAAAIAYDMGKDRAPRVTAKGQGLLAEKIIALARESDVPITQDPALVEILYRLDLDEYIPVELYRAVAEILAVIYLAERERSEAMEKR